jgi:hypothetical protein
VKEAQELELQWRDFERWADERLVRSGRCHESEIFKSFRKSFPRHREQLEDASLRDMVRNWCATVDRSPSGYYKGVSLAPYKDPFQRDLQQL